MTEHLRFEIADRVATITLDRPERMNAFTFAMIDAWAEAIAECRRDDRVRVLVVTGAGKAFCSGGDIVEMQERLAQTPAQRKNELYGRIQRIPLALEDFDKPVLVAVNGAATGAGMDLALMGDLRYAAAVFAGAPFALIGGIDESRNRSSRFFVSRSRSLAELIHAAMNVGVFGFVILFQPIDYGARLLGRRAIIQVNERLAVSASRKDWEILAHR